MNNVRKKIDPVKKQTRFYNLTVLPNMFGEWERIGRGGQIRISFFVSYSQALQAFHRVKAAKIKRGYQVITEQHPCSDLVWQVRFIPGVIKFSKSRLF